MSIDRMTEDEIKNWADKFHRSLSEDLNKIEKKLPGILQDQGYIDKDQLKVVFQWKQANQKGWKQRDINRLNQVSDEYIRLVSEAAFLLEMDVSDDEAKTKVKTLESIPGVGAAKATAVLAFHNPEQYAVGDRILVEALLGKESGFRSSLYPELLDILQELNPSGFDLRTVEKAYWHRYRIENEFG